MPEVQAFKAVPVFFVENVRRSIDWFRDVLGWDEGFVWPEANPDPDYGSVCFGDAVVHLSRCADPAKRQPAHAYVFMRGIDAYGASLAARGVEFEGPKTWEHGMREVALQDPDGNHLCFGEGVESRGEP